MKKNKDLVRAMGAVRAMAAVRVMGAVITLGAVITACSDESSTPAVGDGSNSKYIVAGTSSEATYLLATDRLDAGSVSIVGNGLEVDNSTAFLFYKNKYAYRLVYNQGNAGITTSYQLDGSGGLVERNIRHEIQNRFTTYGLFGSYIITAASGATDQKDAAGNPQYGITYTMIDAEKQTLSTQTVVTEDLLGTGEYCTLSGIVESGNKIYSGVVPEGFSVYGVQNSHQLTDEARKLVNEAGGISGTVNPNSVWVAIYNGTDFDNPKIIKDDRISYATSRFKSQFYPTIDKDEEGNVYVFSASHATSLTGIQKTTRPSGVLRIKAGTEAFDKEYYVNLEDESVAGRAMYKVWHIKGDYFLLQMYKDATDDKSWKVNTHRLGIFKAGDKKFTWVEGLPSADVISSLSKNAYVSDGLAHVAVTTTTAGSKPTLYVINPETATASSGLVVTADGISAVGKLTY